MTNRLLNVTNLDLRLHKAIQKGIDKFIISSVRDSRPDLKLVPDYKLLQIFRGTNGYAYHQLGYAIAKEIEYEYQSENTNDTNRRSTHVGEDELNPPTEKSGDAT